MLSLEALKTLVQSPAAKKVAKEVAEKARDEIPKLIRRRRGPLGPPGSPF